MLNQAMSLCPLQIGNAVHFTVLDQGLLISQLSHEDAGTYQCQGMEQSFSQTIISYRLHIIEHQAMEVLASRIGRHSFEEAESHDSALPRSELQRQRALAAPGANLDEFCNALQQRKRRRQKAWNQKFQQHPLENKKGRVCRQRGPL